MKAITYLTTAIAISALAFTACDNETDPPAGGLLPGQVDIHLAIAGNPDTHTRASINESTGAGSFSDGDKLGMYVKVGSETKEANIEYTVGTTKFFWEELSATEDVTFSAHYPRITESIDDPTAYKFITTDNSTTSDLLAATATASKGNKVELTFHHLMHRLVVKLKKGDNMDEADLSKAEISTASAEGKATVTSSALVDLITCTAVPAEDPGMTTYTATGAYADWIIAPQDLTPDAELLTIKVGKDTWRYKVPKTLNASDEEHPTRLYSGHRLTITLTLNKAASTDTEVKLTSSEITAWDEQTPTDGNADADIPLH